jgi:hypothetical protein
MTIKHTTAIVGAYKTRDDAEQAAYRLFKDIDVHIVAVVAALPTEGEAQPSQLFFLAPVGQYCPCCRAEMPALPETGGGKPVEVPPPIVQARPRMR